jgi:hypothetical protein
MAQVVLWYYHYKPNPENQGRRLKKFRLFCWSLIVLLVGACSSGAVVFAPTPLPPDLSPLMYTHPSGAFTASLPRNWSVYEQYTTVLAAAAFSAPGEDEPAVRFAVINAGNPVSSAALGDLLNRYQTVIRPDAARFEEASRQAMGDGSWRLTGLRHAAGDRTEQVNTFIQQSGTLIGLAEVIVPSDPARLAALQAIVNTFTIGDTSSLQPTQPDTLATAAASGLDILHVSTWTTPAGVFFITGEVANTGLAQVTDVPVRAVLRTGDGLAVAEAVDTIMGYGIPPGGFAPFSLRFGQGQPALTTTYDLSLGSEDWVSQPDRVIDGQDEINWTDESTIEKDGVLVITGNASNTSQKPVHNLRAVVTVFDTTGSVIAAGFTDFSALLNPGDSAAFRIAVPDLGGQPANYILTVQGVP